MAKAEITIYLTGNSPEEALDSFVWDNEDDAADHARENEERFIYSVTKTIEVSDLDEVYGLDLVCHYCGGSEFAECVCTDPEG